MQINEIETTITELQSKVTKLNNQIAILNRCTDADEVLTTNQASKFMKVSREKINEWRETKRLPYIHTGNRYLYRKKDLLGLWK